MAKVLLLLLLLPTGYIPAMKLNYVSCPPIPPRAGMDKQFGLAGPVSGAIGELVMVAGGANFEDSPPWKGGIKSYHDNIFLLSQKTDGTLSWSMSQTKLLFPLAYSACITLKDGFVSLGGENSGGPLKAAGIKLVSCRRCSVLFINSLCQIKSGHLREISGLTMKF